MSQDFARLPQATQWQGSDFSSKSDVAVDLDEQAVAASLSRVRELAENGRNAVDLTQDDIPLSALAGQLTAVRQEILDGRGMVILCGFPVDQLSLQENEIFYWAVGLHLGRPVSQSVMGDRLGHVIDVSGKDKQARAYRNSEELTPHTDPADILAFLCLHPAETGGESIFASSQTVHEIMRCKRPDLLARLYKGYKWHRFGEQPEGFDPITPHRVPVYSEKDGLVSCRIVRQYIEIAADEYPDLALEPDDRAALGMFEELAKTDGIGFRFTLGPGECVVANNYTVLHARTAFEDGDDPARKRHLLRLWLESNPPRPVVPEVFIYGNGEPGIPPNPGKTPYYEHNIDII